MAETVNHPHYNKHASGVEAIDVCEHLSFNIGNAVKYIWRAPYKGNEVEDLRKAEWYLARARDRQEQLAVALGREQEFAVSPAAAWKMSKVVAHPDCDRLLRDILVLLAVPPMISRRAGETRAMSHWEVLFECLNLVRNRLSELGP